MNSNDYYKRKYKIIKNCISIMLSFFLKNVDKLNPNEEIFDALDELQDYVDGKKKKKYEVRNKWEK